MVQKSKQKNSVYMTVFALCVFVALVLGVFVAQHWQTGSKKSVDYSQLSGTFLKQPRALESFKLMSTDNQPFAADNLKGHWTYVFFGFTNCPQLCPTTMAELAKMTKSLNQQNVKSIPQVLMISIDPERDSLAKMKSYVKAFDPSFVGAIGDKATVASLAKQLGVVYMKVQQKGSDIASSNYDIQHSGTIMVFNPQAKLVGFYTLPHDIKAMVSDYKKLTA